jgi:hypothetical protein
MERVRLKKTATLTIAGIQRYAPVVQGNRKTKSYWQNMTELLKLFHISPRKIIDYRLLTTSGAYSLLAMIQQIGDWRDLSEKIVQRKG